MTDQGPEPVAPGHVNSFLPTDPVPGPERPAGNATRQAWLDYSIARQIVVPADATRDEIVAAVDAADGE